MNRLRRQITFLAFLLSAGLIWFFSTSETGLGLAGSCLALSAVATAVTFVQLSCLLRGYGSIYSRLQTLAAFIWGSVLSVAALVFADSHWHLFGGAISMLVWAYAIWRYNVQKSKYVNVGSGPLRADVWVSPPADALEAGDVLCTSVRVATWLHQSTGHTENVIPFDGRLQLFSSWFETGPCINEVSRICKPSDRNHYVVLRRREPLTSDQMVRMEQAAKDMLQENKGFIARLKASRARMPRFLANFLDRKFPATGYDWVGAYSGRLAKDRWTCTGVHLTLMRRVGISTPRLGVGIFGLGTGLFDILNTEDLAQDRGLRYLTLADKAEYEQRKSTQAQA
jgi:hypothetical protein